MVLHLSTYLSRSPARLLDRIQILSRQYAGHDLTLLFALSANFSDTQDLGKAVNGLVQNFDNTRTIGCLSGRLGSTCINGKNIGNDIVSLSVGVWDSKDVKSFRSTIPGREEAQVGRWHAFRKKEEEEKRKDYSLNEGVSWEEVWDGGKGALLPEELRPLDPSQLNGIIYLSDLKPEGLLSSFHHLPGVTKLGLLASSTPFITGRPVTLFHNHSIYSSGAIGLALTGFHQPKPSFKINFLDVRKLSNPMTITKCEGNMINALNDDNPTQLLISAIKKSGLDTHVSGSFKEEQFSLGTLSADGNVCMQFTQITAGDPSRGSLSIDSPFAPPQGTQVIFLHRPSIAIPSFHLNPTYPSPSHQQLNFLTVSDELHLQLQQPSEDHGFEMTIENSFVAASENGFIFERETCEGENVKCSLPGSFGTLLLPSSSSSSATTTTTCD
ncbi:hypothetical protein AN958_07178 [Leucoagaricus sp. SymC.cos]|nr:hypothetical protein AN958_07178 [Leucoagaricus sp. SymC.cos]